MNWDGTVSGVAGGERLRFENLSENRGNSSDNTNSIDGILASSTGTGDNSMGGGPMETENNSSSRSSNLPTTATSSGDGSGTFDAPQSPFAKVNGIAKESPAEDAGMQVGDLVTRFGPLHAKNNDRLRAMSILVPDVAGEGGRIQLLVLRHRSSTSTSSNTDYEDETKWEKLTLVLRPRPFSGRGLLGCHIVPFD
jgi:26S proteasome non-ATPase regulatory subunit 9